MSFLVVAYRYGWANGAQILVSLADDQGAAFDMAAGWKHGDGGKWGLQILEFTAGGEFVQRGYLPSSYNEPGPMFNSKIAMSERVGWEVLQLNSIPDEIQEIINREQEIVDALTISLESTGTTHAESPDNGPYDEIVGVPV